MQQPKTGSNKVELIYLVLIGIFALLTLVAVCPANMPIPGRDSGVFLYNGWRMLNGGIPYKDTWDHKPPVIFFLNTLGLLASGNSRWGVWGLELISLCLTAIISFKLFRRSFDAPSAFIATVLWLFTLGFMLEGGNFTEEFALPLQFACLWLVWKAEGEGSYRWRGILIGVLSGLLFLTKQNTTGIFIAILGYIGISRAISRKWLEMARILIGMLGGFLFVLILVTLLFVIWGAFKDYWSAAFLYNFVYTAIPRLGDRIKSLYRGWLLLSNSNMALFGILGWCLAASALLMKKPGIKPTLLPLLAVGLMDMPLELGMVGLGGRLINHYFMTLLPAFSLFTAFFLNLLIQGLSHLLRNTVPPSIKSLAFLLIFLIFLVVEVGPIREYGTIIQKYRGDVHDNAKVLKTRNYIVKNTSPNDTILVLGAETTINFLSMRVSPSRYTYQYPLQRAGYTTQQMVEEYLDAIIEKRPPLIVAKDSNWISPDNFSVVSPKINDMIGEIQSRYELVIQYGVWSIYGLSGK